MSRLLKLTLETLPFFFLVVGILGLVHLKGGRFQSLYCTVLDILCMRAAFKLEPGKELGDVG
jgi:hypothetical protein